MSSFIVVIFPDEAKAREGARVLKDLHLEGGITLHGLAVAAKDAEGKLSVKESAYEGPHGTAAGALIGGLAGLPGGPVAVAVGVAGGALIGLSADLVNGGVDTEFVDEVSCKLLPNKAAVVAQASAGTASMAVEGIAREEASIRKVMAAYNAALNGRNTFAVVTLYTDDGVFMTPYSPSAVGKDAVAKAYDKFFDEFQFHVKFDVVEAVVMTPTWAFVRTNSTRTTHHNSGRKTIAEANQELVILKKAAGSKWRIACYSFLPTSPPD